MLLGLLRQHQGAVEKRLEQTLDKAPQEVKGAIESKVQKLKNTQIERPPSVKITSPKEGAALSEGLSFPILVEADDNDKVASVEAILTAADEKIALEFQVSQSETSGMLWQADAVVPPGATSVTIEVTATDITGNAATASRTVNVPADPPPTVSILSPAEAEPIIVGSGILIAVRADDNNEVTSVEGSLTANGDTTNLVFVRDATKNWRADAEAPSGATSLTLEVTATDNVGNTASATRKFEVITGGPPKVNIISPADGSVVTEGSSVDVKVEVTSEGEIDDVEIFWSIIDEIKTLNPMAGYWVGTLITPTVSSPLGTVSGSVLPHIFVGEMTIGGSPAPDGTEVVAWVEGGPATSVDLNQSQSGIYMDGAIRTGLDTPV